MPLTLPVEGYDTSSSDVYNPFEEEIKRRQEASLQEHAAYAANLQAKQQEVSARGDDLKTAQLVLQALTPDVPQSARKFLLAGLSGSVGIDPKGDYSKGVQQMLLGLDPQSMEAVRRTFADQIHAPPGAIKEGVRGIFSGQISIPSLLQNVVAKQREFVGSMGTDSLAGGAGEDQLKREQDAAAAGVRADGIVVGGGPKEGDRGAERPSVTPPFAGAPSTDTPSSETYGLTNEQRAKAGQTMRFPGQGETIPRFQATSPALLNALGIDSTVPLRNSDLHAQGYAFSDDAKTQEKLADDINAANQGAVSAVTAAARMLALYKGRPEVLGPVGSAARGIDEIVQQIKGLADIAGGTTADFLNKDSETGKELFGTLKAVSDKLSALYKASGIQGVAIDSARIQSDVLEMAYGMAAAKGIPGNRLTNNIISQQIKTIGASHGSPEQFEAVTKDLVQRGIEEAGNKVGQSIGKPYDFNLGPNAATTDQLKAMAQFPEILPPGWDKRVADELEVRAAEMRRARGESVEVPPRKNVIAPQSPSIMEEQKALQESSARREAQGEATLRSTIQGAELAQVREGRQAEHERFARMDAERRYASEQQRLDLAERKEARAAMHQRQQEIIQAFSRLGSAIAGSIKGGGGGVSGIQAGEQDTGAFRLAPAAQRRAPTPIDASQFQRGVRR